VTLNTQGTALVVRQQQFHTGRMRGVATDAGQKTVGTRVLVVATNWMLMDFVTFETKLHDLYGQKHWHRCGVRIVTVGTRIIHRLMPKFALESTPVVTA